MGEVGGATGTNEISVFLILDAYLLVFRSADQREGFTRLLLYLYLSTSHVDVLKKVLAEYVILQKNV